MNIEEIDAPVEEVFAYFHHFVLDPLRFRWNRRVYRHLRVESRWTTYDKERHLQ